MASQFSLQTELAGRRDPEVTASAGEESRSHAKIKATVDDQAIKEKELNIAEIEKRFVRMSTSILYVGLAFFPTNALDAIVSIERLLYSAGNLIDLVDDGKRTPMSIASAGQVINSFTGLGVASSAFFVAMEATVCMCSRYLHDRCDDLPAFEKLISTLLVFKSYLALSKDPRTTLYWSKMDQSIPEPEKSPALRGWATERVELQSKETWINLLTEAQSKESAPYEVPRKARLNGYKKVTETGKLNVDSSEEIPLALTGEALGDLMTSLRLTEHSALWFCFTAYVEHGEKRGSAILAVEDGMKRYNAYWEEQNDANKKLRREYLARLEILAYLLHSLTTNVDFVSAKHLKKVALILDVKLHKYISTKTFGNATRKIGGEEIGPRTTIRHKPTGQVIKLHCAMRHCLCTHSLKDVSEEAGLPSEFSFPNCEILPQIKVDGKSGEGSVRHGSILCPGLAPTDEQLSKLPPISANFWKFVELSAKHLLIDISLENSNTALIRDFIFTYAGTVEVVPFLNDISSKDLGYVIDSIKYPLKTNEDDAEGGRVRNDNKTTAKSILLKLFHMFHIYGDETKMNAIQDLPLFSGERAPGAVGSSPDTKIQVDVNLVAKYQRALEQYRSLQLLGYSVKEIFFEEKGTREARFNEDLSRATVQENKTALQIARDNGIATEESLEALALSSRIEKMNMEKRHMKELHQIEKDTKLEDFKYHQIKRRKLEDEFDP